MASTQNRAGNLFRAPRRGGDTVLTVATRWYDPAVIVATLDGVVDAANVDTVVDVVLDRAMLCCSLIVDLRAVTYMSISGLEALLLLHGRCEIADTRWTIIPRMRSSGFCIDSTPPAWCRRRHVWKTGSPPQNSMCPSCRWRDPATRAGSPEPVIENRCGTAPPGPHKAFSGPNTARTLGVRPQDRLSAATTARPEAGLVP